MARYQNTVWCDGCGIEITWGALVVGKHHYCCEDCYGGVACKCAEHFNLYEELYTTQAQPGFVVWDRNILV